MTKLPRDDGEGREGAVGAESADSGDLLILPRPDDFHVHLRQGPQLGLYARRHAASFGRALIMPNTVPPIADAGWICRYRDEVRRSTVGQTDFEPLMAFKLLPGMSGETVRECARAGAVAGKYYPAGATTNADDGPRSPDEVSEALDAMQEEGLVLSIHGEDPNAPVLEREQAFIATVERLLASWPRLRIVFEHLSTREAVSFVRTGPERLAATITAHHLLFTLDDMLGAGMNPHLFCKPILKTDRDREALREAAFSASAKFFFGSDSAPHPRMAKESASAPGGVYSAPTALPALAGLFDSCGALGRLAGFVAENGARFYRLPPPKGRLRLKREAWVVPGETDGSVPMCAGATLPWKIV